MITPELLNLYTRHTRINVEYPDTTREQTPYVVRHIEHDRGMVVYSHLNESNADHVIQDEIAYFKAKGISHEFEWKWFDYDTPLDLKDRLEQHGFKAEDEEAVLVLDLSHLPPRLSAAPTSDIRRVRTDAEVDVIVRLLDDVWSALGDTESHAWLGERLKMMLRDAPDRLEAYLAYVDGTPASAAWIDFDAQSAFAPLYGGSTLAPYRGRGLYTDLVATRAHSAIQRGVNYLTIDASPMSRAVLEKLGFELLCMTIPMMYRG